MAKRAVEVCECDRCGKEPANTWFITGPDGAPREIELCEQHAAPIANAYALGRPVTKNPQRPTPARTRGRKSARAQAEHQPQSQPQPRQQQLVEEKPADRHEQATIPTVTFTSLPKPDPEPMWR